MRNDTATPRRLSESGGQRFCAGTEAVAIAGVELDSGVVVGQRRGQTLGVGRVDRRAVPTDRTEQSGRRAATSRAKEAVFISTLGLATVHLDSRRVWASPRPR